MSTMEEDLPTDFDLIVVGTGFPECIIAAAAARVGKNVLHIDKNDYYGGQWTSFTLSGVHQWIQDQTEYSRQQIQKDKETEPETFNELLRENETVIKTADPRQVYTNIRQSWHIPNAPKEDESEEDIPSQDNSNDEMERATPSISTITTNVHDVPPEKAMQTKPITCETKMDDLNDEESSQTVLSTKEAEMNDVNSEEPLPSAVENMDQIENKTSGQLETSPSWSQEEMLKQSRRFNLDLAPKVIYSSGPLVDLLVSSNVARYVEFKCISRVVTWMGGGNETGGLTLVPCSRSDVFTAHNVTLIEKRLLMKLLEFCHSYQSQTEIWKDYASKPFIEFLKHRKLTPNLIHFVIEALAMVPQNITTEEGLAATKLFLNSLGRYGTTPFLFSMYGCGELPQAFCRLCAVFEGTYILRRGLTGVIVDANQSAVGILTDGHRFNCSNLVMDGAYWNPQHLTSSKPEHSQLSISRAILIVDRSILASDKEQLTLLRIPAKDGNPQPVVVIEVGCGSGVTPKDLFCVQLTCSGNNAEADLKLSVQRLFTTQSDELPSTKPKILWSLYFNQLDTSYFYVNSVVPGNVHLCSGPNDLVDYDAPIAQSRKIFSRMYPDEEFLPRAPDPDEIVFDNDGMEPKQDDNFAPSQGEQTENSEKEVDENFAPSQGEQTENSEKEVDEDGHSDKEIEYYKENMEFGDFDDDLFAEERQRGSIDEHYSARFCDPEWFQQDFTVAQISKEDELNVRKYQAEHSFWKKDYKGAIHKYEKALELTNSNNTATHRECYEGLVRCFIKTGDSCKAVNYAKKIHESSKNDALWTVSFSVLIEAHLAAGEYPEALTAAQSLVTLHDANSQVWLKLGYVYSCIYCIKLPQVESILQCQKVTKVENNSTMKCKAGCICCEDCRNKKDSAFTNENYEKGLKIIASCLYRCITILYSTHGTAIGFARDVNEKFREKVTADIDALNLDDSTKVTIISKVNEDVYGPNYIPREDIFEPETKEFVDRGSSRFQNEEKDSQVKELLCNFEKKWFS